MDEPIRVARARKADGALIERLMRHTIAEGAGADHGGDPLIIEAWSCSKQRAQIAGWLSDPALYLNLGRWQGRPVGTGLALRSGEICQCFVLPEHARRGMGRALVTGLEQALQRWGCPRATLYSTPSAVGFFDRLGYACTGPVLVFHGLHLQLMHKSL